MKLASKWFLRHVLRTPTVVLSAIFLLASHVAQPGPWSGGKGNWPQWRGSDGSGVSTEESLPSEWSGTKNILWKTALPGRGHSSPIVWGKRVFVTTAVEGAIVPDSKPPVHLVNGKEWKHPDSMGADRSHALKVICLERDTGKILWEQTAYEGPVYDYRHKKGSYAAPTPATDGRLVYAYFGTEGLFAYDFKGTLKWKVEVGKIATYGMGVGTSPILFENLVILQCDEEDGNNSYVAAFNKKSGKPVWRATRKVQTSWATPIIVDTSRGSELVTSGNENVIAYDPRTGKELWRSQGLDSNAIPSPVAGGGLVFVTAGFPKKQVFALRPSASTEPQVAWTYNKGTAYVPSPILYGDYLYLTTDRGILTCLDARTGEVKYDDGRVPVPATFTASLLAFDGKLFLFGEDGETFVVRAGPKHEVLRTNSLGEPVYSTPAVAAGMLFIRGEKHLFCIRTQNASGSD